MNIGKKATINVDLKADLVSRDNNVASPFGSAEQSSGDRKAAADDKNLAADSKAEAIARKNLSRLIFRQTVGRGKRNRPTEMKPVRTLGGKG